MTVEKGAVATVKFLFQGVTRQNHLRAIKRVLDCPGLTHAIVSVAFANRAGVNLLDEEFAGLGARVRLFVGIRNDITSRQGLQALLSHGADVHIVDTGARQTVFHPKVYFAKGGQVSRLAVGSANLTPGGLNNNIEASVTLDLDLDDQGDRAVSRSVTDKFRTMVRDHPKHVVRLASEDDVEALYEQGRIVDEASSFPPRPAPGGPGENEDPLPRIRLKVPPLPREALRWLPNGPPIRPPGATAAETALIAARLQLVWESKPLTERDLNIPSAENTHATGSINLDKGLLPPEIDHRKYFRDQVFPSLAWEPRSAGVDEAYARFALVVKGMEYGEFETYVRHSTSTTSRTYRQHNAMTRLGWGEMKHHVSLPDLLHRTMFLYRNMDDPHRFVIEID